MIINNWELVAETGYTFEFAHRKHIHVTVRIFTTKGEEAAWKKLEAILNEKNALGRGRLTRSF